MVLPPPPHRPKAGKAKSPGKAKKPAGLPDKARKPGAKKAKKNGKIPKAEINTSEPWKSVKLDNAIGAKAKVEGLLGIETLKSYKIVKKTQRGNARVCKNVRKMYMILKCYLSDCCRQNWRKGHKVKGQARSQAEAGGG